MRQVEGCAVLHDVSMQAEAGPLSPHGDNVAVPTLLMQTCKLQVFQLQVTRKRIQCRGLSHAGSDMSDQSESGNCAG